MPFIQPIFTTKGQLAMCDYPAKVSPCTIYNTSITTLVSTNVFTGLNHANIKDKIITALIK